MNWNFIDLGLCLLIAVSVVHGWQRGLLLGLLDIVHWIGGFILGLIYYQPVARWLGDLTGWSDAWTLPAAFLLILIIAGMLINLLGFALIKRLPAWIHRQPGNQLLGVVPGAVKGLLSATIIATLLAAMPLPERVRATAEDSTIAHALAVSTTRVEAILSPIFGDAVAQTLHTVTVQPAPDERIDLQCTAVDAPPAPDLEAQMLDLVNDERAKVGLASLAADPELAEVARLHSADMLARGYFAHETPEGLSPFDRIRAAGITYRTAGENLAVAPTLSMAHTGLMNSPGHRANILRPEFGRLGIGILDGGACGLMVTQNFRN